MPDLVWERSVKFVKGAKNENRKKNNCPTSPMQERSRQIESGFCNFGRSSTPSVSWAARAIAGREAVWLLKEKRGFL